jgi:putative (di)nucleoside polyphosphate hydrolase
MDPNFHFCRIASCSTVKAFARTSASFWCNAKNEVFWGKRIREHSWQFPQGGIKRVKRPNRPCTVNWTKKPACKPEHVRIIGRTKGWLRYEVPKHWIKREWRRHLQRAETDLVPAASGRARQRRLPARQQARSSMPGAGTITGCRWSVIEFKRGVYEAALMELARLLFVHPEERIPRWEADTVEDAK